MGVGETVVGKMVVGEMGVGETGVGEIEGHRSFGTSRTCLNEMERDDVI
jgi:hypothetical protein